MRTELVLLLAPVMILGGCRSNATRQTLSAPTPGPSRDAVYPDSAEGMQAQMDDLIRLVRMPDAAPFMAALDSLAIPQLHEWIGANFSAGLALQMEQQYTEAFPGFRSHVWWVMGNFAKASDFQLRVSTSELPEALSSSGLEALLPRPASSMRVENYRFSPATPKPPSWVNSFVYVGGRFRFVGGTYPFWAEKLSPLRGPMAIPAQQVGDLTVQAVPFDVDPKTPGIVAIVVMDVKIGSDGRAYGFTVQSGDPSYVDAAEKYVRDWQFFRLATEYPMNVVFFRTKS